MACDIDQRIIAQDPALGPVLLAGSGFAPLCQYLQDRQAVAMQAIAAFYFQPGLFGRGVVQCRLNHGGKVLGQPFNAAQLGQPGSHLPVDFDQIDHIIRGVLQLIGREWP